MVVIPVHFAKANGGFHVVASLTLPLSSSSLSLSDPFTHFQYKLHFLPPNVSLDPNRHMIDAEIEWKMDQFKALCVMGYFVTATGRRRHCCIRAKENKDEVCI